MNIHSIVTLRSTPLHFPPLLQNNKSIDTIAISIIYLEYTSGKRAAICFSVEFRGNFRSVSQYTETHKMRIFVKIKIENSIKGKKRNTHTHAYIYTYTR